MTANAYERFCATLLTYRDQHPELRDGQAHFNALVAHHPELADAIWGEVLGRDPFYRDENLPAFMAYVREHLQDQP